MSVTRWLDGFQRRHPGAGFPIAVVYKYVDDSGGYLAAILTYYALVSLFPLLLLLATVLGLVLSGHPDWQQRVLGSTLHQFPVVGEQLGSPKGLSGGGAGLAIGIIGLLYGGLGVAQALQYAMNIAWTVPRNNRPNPFKARGRSLLVLGVAGLGVLLTAALSTIGSSNVGSFGSLLRAAVLGLSVLLDAALFVFLFRFCAARSLSLRDVAPGAVLAAVVWQLLQSFGVLYVRRVVNGASATNGVFALVLGLIAFLYLTAVLVIFCVEVNVVRVDRLAPRALLTPFTDNVELTHADRRAYTDQAEAQRTKGFEDIDVSFDPPRREPDQQ